MTTALLNMTPSQAAESGTRVRGYVKHWKTLTEEWNDSAKRFTVKGGYGFITVREWQGSRELESKDFHGNPIYDIYVHNSGLAIPGANKHTSLRPSQCVEFRLEKTDKGWMAVDVKVVRP